MTLGEKIRCARKCAGLSQGQLADQLCVSRSAVAKWETDKGMPDVENLKYLSRLLSVSVDSLLSDQSNPDSDVIRQTIRLEGLGRGCDRIKRDRFVCSRFPGAKIIPLMARPEVDQSNLAVDDSCGALIQDPFGNQCYLKSIRDIEQSFYLVERNGDQFFVTVGSDSIEIRFLLHHQTERVFRLGTWNFICREELDTNKQS